VLVTLQESCYLQAREFHSWVRTYIDSRYVGAFYPQRADSGIKSGCDPSNLDPGHGNKFGILLLAYDATALPGDSPDAYELIPFDTQDSTDLELRGYVCVRGLGGVYYEACGSHTRDAVADDQFYELVHEAIEPRASGGTPRKVYWGGDFNLNQNELPAAANQNGASPAWSYSRHREADRCVSDFNRWTFKPQNSGAKAKIDWLFNSGAGTSSPNPCGGVDAVLSPGSESDMPPTPPTGPWQYRSDHRLYGGYWI
jgi:hypothetical protein